jgi:archaemetzincin
MKNVLLLLLSMVIFLLLSCESNQKISHKKKTKQSFIIALQPFTDANQENILLIQKAITTFYHYKTIILPAVAPPKSAFIQLKTPRYRADSLLLFLWKNCPDSISHIIGIASFDISITKRDSLGNIKKPIEKYTDFGIYGLGYCPGKSCIISYNRLQHKNEVLTKTRITKVVLHELGHNFGLPHCPINACLMQDAKESMKTIDKEKLELCITCKMKLEDKNK